MRPKLLWLTILASLALLLPARAGEDEHKGWDVSCRDVTVCTDLTCSTHDAIYRAGHRCRDFPKYNGGPPVGVLDWDAEDEFYECLEYADAASSYCVTWSTLEVSEGERETGSCGCTQMETSYCGAWECVQREVNLCNPGEWESGRQCCYRDADHDVHCYTRDADETEYTSCECVLTSDTGYCSAWTCEERGSHGGVEYETYKCSQDGEYFCAAWDGDIDSSEEFELAGCRVTETTTSGEAAHRWECYEKGLDYHRPALWFTVLPGVMMGVSWVMLQSTCRFDGNVLLRLLIAMGTFALAVFLSTIIAGVVCLLLSLAVFFVLVVAGEVVGCVVAVCYGDDPPDMTPFSFLATAVVAVCNRPSRSSRSSRSSNSAPKPRPSAIAAVSEEDENDPPAYDDVTKPRNRFLGRNAPPKSKSRKRRTNSERSNASVSSEGTDASADALSTSFYSSY